MKSIFANLELDTIRYSLVWEDWNTLYNHLEIQSQDHVAIITSAGCNVLNALLKQPAGITAVDLNPVQNELLRLKLHVIQHHHFETWRGIMGFAGKKETAKAWQNVRNTLSEKDVLYWQDFISNNTALISAGRLEKYINGYFTSLPQELQEKIKRLFRFRDVKEQSDYYCQTLLHNKTFVDSFTTYFADENLSSGRDPRLFTYAEQKGGTTFFKRLGQFLSANVAADNFYLRFFFFGAEDIPQHILPPCHQPQYFDALKQQAHKVKLVTGEAVDYLLTQGNTINKASFSNIFEYISHKDFEEVVQLLFSQKRSLRVVYWNLLQNQLPSILQKSVSYYNAATENTACFYFNNTIVIQHSD